MDKFEWLFTTDTWDFLNVVTLSIGAFIIWILSRLKSIYELQKQSLDNKQIHVELLEKLFENDKEQREHLEVLMTYGEDLVEAIEQKEFSKLIEIRKKIFREITIGYVRTFYKYYKLSNLIEGRNRDNQLAKLEVLSFLETCIAFITYINSEKILRLINKKPITFNPSTFDFALSFLKSKTRFWEIGTKKRIKRCDEYFNKYYSL